MTLKHENTSSTKVQSSKEKSQKKCLFFQYLVEKKAKVMYKTKVKKANLIGSTLLSVPRDHGSNHRGAEIFFLHF